MTNPNSLRYLVWLATSAFASGVDANSGHALSAAARNVARSSSDQLYNFTPLARNIAAASVFFLSKVKAVRRAKAYIAVFKMRWCDLDILSYTPLLHAK